MYINYNYSNFDVKSNNQRFKVEMIQIVIVQLRSDLDSLIYFVKCQQPGYISLWHLNSNVFDVKETWQYGLLQINASTLSG